MKLTALVLVQDLTIGTYLNILLTKRYKNINVIEKHFEELRLREKIAEYSPDIVFCEIDHFDSDSFELVTKIPIQKSNLVFILKKQTPSLKAIQFAALHYLVKPFSAAELKMVMEKVLTGIKEKDRSNSSQKSSKISLSTQSGYKLVDPQSIVYINSSGNYCTVFMNSGEKVTLTKLLGEFEQILPKEKFVRVHQSYIVNTAFIAEVMNSDGLQVVLKSGNRVPVARRRKKELFKILGI